MSPQYGSTEFCSILQFEMMLISMISKEWLNLLSKGLSVQYIDEIHDFVDGDEYEQIKTYFPVDPNKVHDLVLYFMLCTDGGNRFKSSSRSF